MNDRDFQGFPGAGKTTLALQFLLAGADKGEQGVYATLSEIDEELRHDGISEQETRLD